MTALVDLYNTDHLQLINWVAQVHGISNSAQDQFQNHNRLRRECIARRLRYYRDNAELELRRIIDTIYETQSYRETLHRYIGVALEQNVTRRIVDEVASLYDRPALRILKKRDAEFHAEEKRLRLHEIMQESHRLMTLCNELLIWQFTGVDNQTALRMVTPDMFDAIPHPMDALVPAGFLIDALPRAAILPSLLERLPHYELWDDTYRYLINKLGYMVDEWGNAVDKPLEHGLKRIPGALLHRREPTVVILDSFHGADIESAHAGVALLNVMIMRLSKAQGENQPILAGNLAAMATGQVANGERPLLLPPEVTASMLNMKTDPDHYLKAKRDKITSVAQTYGMSYEQFTFQETADTASGKAYQVRREKLTEIRLEQRRRAVLHEALVVDLMGFDSDGMRVDYQEQAMPQDAVEKVALLADKMKLGLDSPISYLMREDPDLSRDDAQTLLKKNLADYAGLIQMVRALNMPSGADAANPGNDPTTNGALNDAPNESISGKDDTAKNAAEAVAAALGAVMVEAKRNPPGSSGPPPQIAGG